MGYLGNHLAAVVCGAFAAVLTALWFIMSPMFPILDFIFLMAVPIAWFLTFMCWIVQKGADYSHKYFGNHTEKKNHNNPIASQIYTPEGKLANSNNVAEAKTRLKSELDELRDTVKIKESQIEHLKQQITNLQTQVEIESIKTEIANLKMLASKKRQRKPKN